MTTSYLKRFNPSYLKRLAIFWGVILVGLTVVFLLTWNTFFVYVKPGQHLIIIAKDGKPMPPGHVLAGPGEQGPRAEVLGEGWHFVMPIVYETRLGDNTVIGPGEIGILTALGGDPLPEGQFLAEEGQQGILRRVLTPGSHRINLLGYKVAKEAAVEIRPGYVGVQRRLFSKEGQTERGYLKEILHPGIYYVNTREIEVILTEVGLFQTTFAKLPAADVRTPITFTSRGGFDINVDCTVEWEILPQDMPYLVAEYGTRKRIEDNVIDLQTHAIGRDKGSDYGIQDLLEGSKRQKFQEDFTKELISACKQKNVTVHSAFIRNIDIPEDYLKQIRDKQLAVQKTETNKAREATALTKGQVEEAKETVEQEVKRVEAETKSIVAVIDNKVENLETTTTADLEKMRAINQAEIAKLSAERDKVVGEAEAEAKELQETARSAIFQMKLEAFQNDATAFLRYTLADKLNPALRLRLFQSGQGTFWTNMDGSKGFNLMLNPTGPPRVEPEEKKDASRR